MKPAYINDQLNQIISNSFFVQIEMAEILRGSFLLRGIPRVIFCGAFFRRGSLTRWRLSAWEFEKGELSTGEYSAGEFSGYPQKEI